MTDPTPPDPDTPADAGAGDASFEELRHLLVGPEQARLDALAHRLDDPETRTEEVSHLLADAVLKETGRSDRLGEALAPTVEESLQVSIRRNPRALVDAISPIMGPAIRRSIIQAINGMVQSLNATMEQSFSPQGLKWRWEAFRTGKSFGEVVALHTLRFQVEQVFLIHRETGLLLAHRSVLQATDPDLIGSMLVAIRDFVSDSFDGGEGTGTLDTIQVGERTVWVETGRDAVLAAVVRGIAPESLRETLTGTLEQIEIAFGEALRAYDGDDSGLEEASGFLSECLVSQGKEEEVAASERRSSPLPWLLWGGVGVALLAWLSVTTLDRMRWGAFVDELRREPGVVVVDHDRLDGRWVLWGLRDPLAADDATLLARTPIDAERIELRLSAYEALEPEWVAARARNRLGVPAQATLTVEGETLVIGGTASAAWLAGIADRALLLGGVSSLRVEAQIPEIDRLRAANAELATLAPGFPEGSVTLLGTEALDRIGELVQESARLAAGFGEELRVEVIGSANPETGTPDRNLRLAERRAQLVVDRIAGPSDLTFEVGGEMAPLTASAEERRVVRVRLDVDALEAALRGR